MIVQPIAALFVSALATPVDAGPAASGARTAGEDAIGEQNWPKAEKLLRAGPMQNRTHASPICGAAPSRPLASGALRPDLAQCLCDPRGALAAVPLPRLPGEVEGAALPGAAAQLNRDEALAPTQALARPGREPAESAGSEPLVQAGERTRPEPCCALAFERILEANRPIARDLAGAPITRERAAAEPQQQYLVWTRRIGRSRLPLRSPSQGERAQGEQTGSERGAEEEALAQRVPASSRSRAGRWS